MKNPIATTIDHLDSCLESINEDEFVVARVCRELDYCETNPCLRKCCSETIGKSCLDDSLRQMDARYFRESLHKRIDNTDFDKQSKFLVNFIF